MTNNFDAIKTRLSFDTDDDYYFVQVLIRAKDDKTLGSNNRLIKTYAIKSIKSFEKYQAEIIKLCESFTARAYIHLTKRSFKKVSLLMMRELCDRITNDQCPEISRVFNSASGTYNDAKNKTWIIDIDQKDNMRYINDVIRFVENQCEPIGAKYIMLNDTPNGFHIITKPFNLAKFKEVYPDIDVHKNNPTVLYSV